MTATGSDVYYDPYDFEIDTDPYPVWKRLRDERPLYYNEKYDFCALSRFDDVERALVDWSTYSSAKGSLLELIKADIEMPPGHRSSSRTRPATTSTAACCRGCSRRRRCSPSSPRSASSAPAASTRSSAPAASTSSPTSAPQMPMRTIGMLLGIPEEDQEAIRDRDRRGPAHRRGRRDAATQSTSRR